jgi:hypothetical protein
MVQKVVVQIQVKFVEQEVQGLVPQLHVEHQQSWVYVASKSSHM